MPRYAAGSFNPALITPTWYPRLICLGLSQRGRMGGDAKRWQTRSHLSLLLLALLSDCSFCLQTPARHKSKQWKTLLPEKHSSHFSPMLLHFPLPLPLPQKKGCTLNTKNKAGLILGWIKIEAFGIYFSSSSSSEFSGFGGEQGGRAGME